MENIYELEQNTSDDSSDSEESAESSGDSSDTDNEGKQVNLNNSFLNDVKKTD
jgi:hypothetical protein